MIDRSVFRLSALALLLTAAAPAGAQSDPVTRFLDGFFKPAPPETPPAPQPAPVPKPAPARAAKPETAAGRPAPAARPEAVAAKPIPMPAPAVTARAEPAPLPKPEPAPRPVVPLPQPVAVQTTTPPSTPQAAVERINSYFNAIDQLTASFTQTSASGRTGGTLALKRPGQLRFAYAPPSTLEIVSDGRSVAVRDKKLGTNDVYPVGQTPLKFLLKEDFDLGRDTKLRDVQTGPDGIVTVRFEDSATLGGTSKISLRFDARSNTLRQWTVIDPQGFETTVSLSDVQVVRRQSAGVVE
jgi:outer membrane lipoprotein-sorting protein